MICKLYVCICGCVFWIYLYSDWFDSLIIFGLRLSVTVSYSLYSVWVWNPCTWTHIFPISHFSLQTFPIHTLKLRLLLITRSLAILTPPVTISLSHTGSDPSVMTSHTQPQPRFSQLIITHQPPTAVILADGPYVNDLILAWCSWSAVTVI